jgi:hypothetical protein
VEDAVSAAANLLQLPAWESKWTPVLECVRDVLGHDCRVNDVLHAGPATLLRWITDVLGTKGPVEERVAGMVWHALAERGLIPEDWLDDPRRRFQRAHNPAALEKEAYRRASEGRAAPEAALLEQAKEHHPLYARPQRLREVIALATHARDVLAAEAIADQVVPGASPGRIRIWWVLPRRGGRWKHWAGHRAHKVIELLERGVAIATASGFQYVRLALFEVGP